MNLFNKTLLSSKKKNQEQESQLSAPFPSANLLPLPEAKSDLYAGTIESEDFVSRYFERHGRSLSLCIFLKKCTPIRKSLFEEINKIESREQTLMSQNGKVSSCPSWPISNFVYCVPLQEKENGSRLAHLIHSGIQLRFKASIYQSDMIQIREKLKPFQRRHLS